jgi:hypothetical protein
MNPNEHFLIRSPSLVNYWRGIILFGRNVATYKFALARSLLELAPAPGTLLRLEDLAEPFSRHLCEHLRLSDTQSTARSSRFLQVCRDFNAGTIDQEALQQTTVRLGFNNVIDAFHVVNQQPIEPRFYVDERAANGGIRITDEFAAILGNQGIALDRETNARWRLVETAWHLGLTRNAVIVDVDPAVQGLFVQESPVRRVPVTSCRDALNGYQKGRCFYCYRALTLEPGDTDVDHFLPHVLKRGPLRNRVDGVWNLVLACADCNRGESGKFARVPSLPLLGRLWRRNEYLIASHHPLRETLMAQTGALADDRLTFLTAAYQVAVDTLFHPWEPSPQADDPFLRS